MSPRERPSPGASAARPDAGALALPREGVFALIQDGQARPGALFKVQPSDLLTPELFEAHESTRAGTLWFLEDGNVAQSGVKGGPSVLVRDEQDSATPQCCRVYRRSLGFLMSQLRVFAAPSGGLRYEHLLEGSGVAFVGATRGALERIAKTEAPADFEQLRLVAEGFLASSPDVSKLVESGVLTQADRNVGPPSWSGDGQVRFGAWLLEGAPTGASSLVWTHMGEHVRLRVELELDWTADGGVAVRRLTRRSIHAAAGERR